MELLVRYLDRSNSVSSSVSQDTFKDENLRDDLRFYFMNPCEKYRARKHIPWKLGVQVLKIIMVTTQLILFGLSNQLVVSYKEESTMALKQLFIKNYGGEDQDDYSASVFTQQDFYSSVSYVMEQYSRLEELSVGPISYSEDKDSKPLPLVICKRLYKKRSLESSKHPFQIDTEQETGCLSFDPKSVKQWKMQSSSFLDLDFYRLIEVSVNFQLEGINLQTVRLRELPDCYTFNITINFDNSCHSGKLKIFLYLEISSFACKEWKIYGSAEKNMHLFLMFDLFVILVCLTSATLCARSMILAIRLLQRFSRLLLENHGRKVCEDDQKEFLNGWYVLVIVGDLLAIIGSILKIEIQAKDLTSYDVCSIFLGTSTLLVWVSVIRYLGYFEKYNVLILTMRVALPKVLRFCCCAGMIYLGYTFCGWIVLGPYHEKFEQLSRVAECLFSLLNGDDMFATFAQLKAKNTLVWFFSRAYLYSFISMFIYMVLSLFIALITDSYETVKQHYHKKGLPLTDLQKFLMEQLESSDMLESHGTVAHDSFSVFCCWRRDCGNQDD
ncbi:mucolipin-2 isoform X1 [Takifugu flavidus]|uniref:mucolipin-2 isoform X1 n=1 Tax=Takifugu flavidus TaxID=433684 RepID=UPI002544B818|nr:mucolipin-2 isoform X1 [Takifugu flavidus]